MTDSTTDVDLLLENLKQLINNCDRPSKKKKKNNNCDSELMILDEKDQVEALYDDLRYLRSFLKDAEEKRREHEELESLVARIRDSAYEAEDIIDPFLANITMKRDGIIMGEKIGHHEFDFDPPLKLGFVLDEIKSIREEVVEIYHKNTYDIGAVQAQTRIKSSSIGSGSSSSTVITRPLLQEEIVVGFDDEAKAIVERLTGLQRQLEVISIVGMAGLGKTTLARKVYDDRFVAYHFRIRAWTYVSQLHHNRNLLLGILSSIIEITDEIYRMTEENLGEELYKLLKGKRYLIVMDDIWNVAAWDDLERCFPDDCNGSRIIFTSRLTEVVLHARPESAPHCLRFLTQDESWDLFQRKVFRGESCPEELMEIGKQIVGKCQGLPLAIVVIAGLLAKKEKTEEWWKQVSESVGSYIVSDPEQYMDTLSLSYNHLPHYLRSCFLYFGAFPEDYEIPVRKLIWLWVSEGFIQQNVQERAMEEVAEDYLMDLIDRSLVMVAKRKSDGSIKRCRIHDLLRDLCLRNANKDNFLQQIYRFDRVSSPPPNPIATKHRRLCIHSHIFDYTSSKPPALRVRSFLCFTSERGVIPLESTSFLYQAFKLLRVLDLSTIGIFSLPSEIELLVHLRYLAFRPHIQTLPPSISNLRNLETLIVDGLSNSLDLPDTIWKMAKLRHLYIDGRAFIPRPREPDKDGHSFVLDNLQTVFLLHLSGGDEEMLARIPNLRELTFVFFDLMARDYNQLPKLDYLTHLESLTIVATCFHFPARFSPSYKFPTSLKKLVLSELRLEWTEMSILGKLPNLEVLKLVRNAFTGPLWETSDGEFPELKSLKIQELDFEEWKASDDHFPSLQYLVLSNCEQLKEIPSAFGYMSTLEKIELKSCSRSAANSARQIQEEQESMGNDCLKFFIYPPNEDCITESEEDPSDDCWCDLAKDVPSLKQAVKWV